MNSTHTSRILLFVVVLAAMLRIGVVWRFQHELYSDPDAYRNIAVELAAGNGYINSDTNTPTAFRPPLYPLILAGLFVLNVDIVGLAILHILLSTMTVWFTFKLGKFVHSEFVGVMAAGLVAVDPLLLRYTSQPMTETLFTFLMTSCLLFLLPVFSRTTETTSWRRWAAGFLFGLCALCRPTVWMFAAFCVCWQIWVLWKERQAVPILVKVRYMLPVVIGGIIIVSPWLIRNLVQFQKPIFTTTHGGYTLLLGNNRVFYQEVVSASWGTVWGGESLRNWQEKLERKMQATDIARSNECARDAWMYQRAQSEIAEQPNMFVRACLLRIMRFWNIVPQGDQTRKLPSAIRWGIGLFYSLILCGLVVTLFRKTRSPSEFVIPLWLLLASFTLVHTFYWSNMRMRSALIPIIAVLVSMVVSGMRRDCRGSL